METIPLPMDIDTIDDVLTLAPEEAQFSVDSEETANWVLAKLGQLQADLARDRRIAEAQIQQAQRWLEQRQRTLNTRIAWWAETLRSFALRRFTESKGKVKTISLPYGRIGLRQPPDEWNYDEERLLAFLRDNAPDLVRTKHEVNKQALKRAAMVTAAGEVVLKERGVVVEGVKVNTAPNLVFHWATLNEVGAGAESEVSPDE